MTMEPSENYNTPYRSHHLRAKGNLSYLEFIRCVQIMWEEGHPDIPLVAAGGGQAAAYPSIIYSLQLRKTHPGEPKMRYREDIMTDPGEPGIIIGGQRFQNVINFAVVTERDPQTAEELIEVFEDFMFEYIPVFKELGISELVYGRRLADDEQPRGAVEGAVFRTVSYLVTTEKVIQISARKLNDSLEKLNTIVIHARQAALVSPAPFSASAVTDRFTFSEAAYNVGDALILRHIPDGVTVFPVGADGIGGQLLSDRTYYVQSITDVPDVGLEYTLTASYGGVAAFTVATPGSGWVALAEASVSTTSVTTTIEDDLSSTP